MADLPTGSPGSKGFWPDWLTPRRAWDFTRNVINLERTVATLREDNRKLSDEMIEIQKTPADHDAQLRLLTDFVRDSLSSRLEAKLDRLAAELLANKNKN
jgi:uncharacterized coiled-coil protein SlyX